MLNMNAHAHSVRGHNSRKFVTMQPKPQSYQRVVIRRLIQIFWLMETDPLEVGIAFLMLVFSLQLLNPLYDTFGTGPVYSVMRAIAPDWLWGMTGLTISLLNMSIVIFNHRVLKIYTNMMLTVYIMFIAALVGLSNPYGTGVTIYSGLTTLMIIVTIRSAKDAV